MDLTPHIDSLRRDLTAATEVAAPETRAAVERLLFALTPAVRLALMDAVSQAAAEITTKLPSGSIDVRLNGRELDFVVQVLGATETAASRPSPEETDDDGSLARISLRMPEALKTKAEELANRSGQSLNNWLVNVVRTATRGDVPPPGSDPSTGGDPFGGNRGGRRMTGWV